MTTQPNAPLEPRSLERLALAACGVVLWPNPYAREYHRAAVLRMLRAMTAKDLTTLRRMMGQ